MAGYSYNKTGFGGAEPHQLKLAYCGLVAIELALKDSLGKLHNSGNGGHDVPALLQQYAGASNETGTFNALASQLSSALSAMWSQGKNGVSKTVPPSCYPYLRYLRHDSDGWGGDHSSDAEVQHLVNVVSSTRALLKNKGVL